MCHYDLPVSCRLLYGAYGMKFVLYFLNGKSVFDEDEIYPGRSSYFLCKKNIRTQSHVIHHGGPRVGGGGHGQARLGGWAGV